MRQLNNEDFVGIGILYEFARSECTLILGAKLLYGTFYLSTLFSRERGIILVVSVRIRTTVILYLSFPPIGITILEHPTGDGGKIVGVVPVLFMSEGYSSVHCHCQYKEVIE